MSDLEKTAQVVYESCYGRNLHHGQVSSIVRGLNDAGLLAPDLPEVSKGTPVHWTPEWEKHAEQGAEEAHLDGTNVFLDQGNQKTIALAKGSHIDHYGVGEARAVALALLAATDYAEKEQGNE